MSTEHNQFRNRKSIYDVHISSTNAIDVNIETSFGIEKDHRNPLKWYPSYIYNKTLILFKYIKAKLTWCKIVLILIICVVFFIYYGHYMTCYISIQLCSPFHLYLRMLHSHILQNAVMDYATFEHNLQSMYDQHKDNNIDICADKVLMNPCPERLKLGIILSQRHGGSTWIVQELNKHPLIRGHREKLEVWENNNCALFAKIENAIFNGLTLNFNSDTNGCNANTLLIALKHIYNGFFRQKMETDKKCNGTMINGYTKSHYIFWKLQIDQLHTSMFKLFIDFVYCNSIMVIQIIRLASIEGFISYQMSTIERLSTMDFEKIFKHKQLNHSNDYIIKNESIYIDPILAEKYVRKIDQNRKYIGELIEYYPFDMAYIRFNYEDLIGIHADKYWNAMFSFIGLDNNPQQTVKKANELEKKHSIPCYKKITNWNQVKQHLHNTTSYWMCDKVLFG